MTDYKHDPLPYSRRKAPITKDILCFSRLLSFHLDGNHTGFQFFTLSVRISSKLISQYCLADWFQWKQNFKIAKILAPHFNDLIEASFIKRLYLEKQQQLEYVQRITVTLTTFTFLAIFISFLAF